MWAAEQRTRHKVRVPTERKRFPTDISGQEWKLVEHYCRALLVPDIRVRQSCAK